MRSVSQPGRRGRALRFFRVAVVAALGGASMVRAAPPEGAPYPSRTIHIVVGFPPGGPTDRLAREVAQGLQAAWGQPVVVDNKPGASSRIAFEAVARAEPDGHTLILGSLQTATNMALNPRGGYDTLRDFAPVTQLTSAVLALTVGPTHSARSLDDLVVRARQRPEALSYASFGVASSAHFAGALFEQRAGARLLHVPFSGAAQAQTAVIGGQVDFGFTSALSALPLMQSGKLRALAVAADKRLARLPDVPTMAEAGFPGFVISSWQGLLAPAATPPEVVHKLHRELSRWLARPEVRERLAAAEAEPVGSSPEEFRAHIASEIVRWTAVARQAGMVSE